MCATVWLLYTAPVGDDRSLISVKGLMSFLFILAIVFVVLSYCFPSYPNTINPVTVIT